MTLTKLTVPVSANLLYDLLDEIGDVCFATAYTLTRLEEATDDLLMQGTQIEWDAAVTAEDIRQAAVGNTRVACQWCDGEFYVPDDVPGPHTCWRCRHCDGY